MRELEELGDQSARKQRLDLKGLGPGKHSGRGDDARGFDGCLQQAQPQHQNPVNGTPDAYRQNPLNWLRDAVLWGPALNPVGRQA